MQINRKRNFRAGVLIIGIVVLAACNDTSTNENVATTNTTAEKPKDNSVITPKGDSEFGIKIDGTALSLSQWEHQVGSLRLPGNKIDEKTDTLGAGADTHMGSKTKTQNYGELVLKWFSPRDSDSFWLQEIAVKSNAYPTLNGLRVGDPVATVTNVYPQAKRLSRNGKDYFVYSDETQTKNLEIEINKNKVSGLRFFYEMN